MAVPISEIENVKSYFGSLLSDIGPVHFNDGIQDTSRPNFSKLRVLIKQNLVAVRNSDRITTQDLDLQPNHLTPEDWHKDLSSKKQDIFLLDMRNRYEYDVGHFDHAVKMNVDTFRQGMDLLDELTADKPKDQDIYMYCTGGIRCSVAGAYLRHKGYQHVKMGKTLHSMVEEESRLLTMCLRSAITVEANAIILPIVPIRNAIYCLSSASNANPKCTIHVARIVKMFCMAKKTTSLVMTTTDKYLKHVDRWSFTMELVNMWNIKPDHGIYSMDSSKNQHRQRQQQHHHSDNMFSSSHLLTQLLISQAMLDSNDYEILTFDKLDKLKKELSQIQDQSANISKNIQLENRIASISKSLENVNLKNSRNSVMYLQHQRQHNEDKIKSMSNQLEKLKKRQVEIKKTILQHTAATLNKGIFNIENQTLVRRRNDHSSTFNQVTNRINRLYSAYISLPSSAASPDTLLQKLSQLDKLLSAKSSSERDIFIANQNKMQLLAIRIQKDQLMSKMLDMELFTTKLLSHISAFPQRQMAFRMEIMQYQSESLEIRIWEKKQQRNEDADNLSQALTRQQSTGGSNSSQVSISEIKQRYQKQLDDQARFYEADLSRQNASLQRNKQLHQQLEVSCNELVSEKSELDRLVQEKSRQIDQQDNEISRLNHELRNLRHPPQQQTVQSKIPGQDDSADSQFVEAEKIRLKKDFENRESRWTSHTTMMEDRFDHLLDNFDKLTNSAIEFDSHRMRYDKRIENLHQNISNLELELYDEKLKRIGYSAGHEQAPTTVSLRKEFRLLVADMKKTHQLRMEREAEEIRRLQLQLQDLQNTNTRSYKYQHSMATQT
ncbi:hypothetical protein [Parasitella parasitica]|uniref:Rhodanese domain-containing protein n=1 Tax=Parasitella parasitica TaxID=35722 RepID=A0A0B7N084_9FUNG|nr:hypothetical protein [Parasitella parasitica]